MIKQNKQQKQDATPKKVKTEFKRREPPSILYPILLFTAIACISIFLNWLEFLGRTATFWIFGICSLLLLISIPIFLSFTALQNKRVLALVVIASVLTAASFLFELNRIVDFGDVQLTDELSETNRTINLKLQSGSYWAIFTGHFHPGEPGKEVVAKYTIKLKSGEKDLDEFSDQFQIIHKKRKMARRSYGYQEYQNLADRFKVKIKKDLPHTLSLSYIDPKLEKIEVNFYIAKPSLFWCGLVLAILALVTASELDALLKASKYRGYFAFSLGAALGFIFYYGTEALPESKIGAFAFDLLVGGILGMVIGGAFFYALNPLMTRLNKKFKLLISR